MPRLSIAPLMGYSDRHFRYFLRQLSRKALLYTEMIPAFALSHGKKFRYIDFDPEEYPLALQVGGSQPESLAFCAKLASERGFHSINLNVGCPSPRVQEGNIGLCLLKQPELVKRCIEAMKAVSSIPVTVKTRIGVDDQDSFEYLCEFIQAQIEAGVDHVTLHARKGWLAGLSPKENRTLPPLHYDRVYEIRKIFPKLSLGINGGIQTLEQAQAHLIQVDEVMMGRAAIDQPYLFAQADTLIFKETSNILSREDILDRMKNYLAKEKKLGTPTLSITRHWLGLYAGEPGAKAWRSGISQGRME